MKPYTTKTPKVGILERSKILAFAIGWASGSVMMLAITLLVLIAISLFRNYQQNKHTQKPTITEQLSQEEKVKQFDLQVGDSAEATNLTAVKIQKPKTFAIRGYCFLRSDSAHSNYYYILLVQFRPSRQQMRCYVQKDTQLGKYLFEKFKSGYGDVMTVECQWGDGKWIDDDEALITRITKEE